MTNRQYHVFNLSNIPTDIIRQIIRQERPYSTTALCLISPQWNDSVKDFFEKRPLKPAIKCAKFSKKYIDVYRAKVPITIDSEHLEYFGSGFEKDKSGALAHTQISLMKRVNSRKVVDPRLANTIWRCSRINVLELNLLTKNTALERAIRRCLSSVAVQSLEIDRLESFDLGVQTTCVGMIRAHVVKELKISANLFPFGVSQFIIDAMKSVETLEIFELFPTAKHRLRFGTVKEDLLYLIQHLRVDWHLDAKLLTRSDQQLRRFGPDYRSLIRVRTIVPIEISDSE